MPPPNMATGITRIAVQPENRGDADAYQTAILVYKFTPTRWTDRVLSFGTQFYYTILIQHRHRVFFREGITNLNANIVPNDIAA